MFAKDSLRLYRSQDISKVGNESIPDGVSRVRFVSDLTDILPVAFNNLTQSGNLFRSI